MVLKKRRHRNLFVASRCRTALISGLFVTILDCRVLPGSEEHFREQVTEIVGDGVQVDWTWQPPLEFPFEGDLVEAMKAALFAEDPDGF